MAYGDKIDFGKIKDSRLFYKKPSERSFNQNWIQFDIINSNNELLKMLQDKNKYLVERHLTKDYAEWKIEHDKKATL